MADTYLLNGSTIKISVRVNDGTLIELAKFADGPTATHKIGLKSDKGPDVLGRGDNEVLVIAGGVSTKWNLNVGSQVNLTLDVQLVLFANALQPKNTISTAGFTVTKEASEEITAEVSSFGAAQAPSSASGRLLCLRRPPAVRGETSAEISFSLLGSDQKGALYAASNNTTAGPDVAWTDFYLFLAAGSTPPPTLTLEESWAAAGAYVFLSEDVATATLLVELAAALSQQDTNFSRLAWRLGPASYDVVQASTASAVADSVDFAIGGWQLSVARNTTLSLDSVAPGIRLQKASGEDTLSVRFVRGGIPKPIGTLPQEILIPLDGTDRGTHTLAWDWEHYQLGNDLGGILRIFFGEDAANAAMAQYPLFTPAANPGPFPVINLYFHVYLQPLAPLDGDRTRLALDLGEPNELTSHFLSSTTNAPVSVQPAAPSNGGLAAGFGFAKNTGQEESDRYLCPVGEYEVAAVGLVTGNSRVQIRGGIAGTEYVLVEPGDRLLFENDRPAFAAGFDPEKPKPMTLDDTLTTAWVRVLRREGAAALSEEVVDTSYCAQSSASTYFGSELDQANALYDYPIAVGASLVQFAEVKDDIPFPMLPYGGVFFENSAEQIPNPNPDLSAEALGSIEQKVVAPDRRDQLEPLFDKKFGPIFFDTSTNVAFDGGFARTPLGLLAELNKISGGTPPAGTIKRILLARSPQNAEQFLALDAGTNGVVNPSFANIVLDDNLFLVATDQSALDPFANVIQLGDFTFEAKLGDSDDKAIAVFKFVPGVSARELIGDTDAWSMLIGTESPEKIELIQKRLEDYLAMADAGGDLFAAFRQMIDDPNWNGLLIFNVPLVYQALPLDIQILLGGIEGPLRAHHFGVTVNQVEDRDSSTDLDHSSLFSVINYEAEFENPPKFPDFQVLIFNVRYANSELAVFDSQIAFSIKDLFGSPVTLKVAPETDFKATGTIVINGVYTLFEDGTGSLVFSTQDLRSYSYDADDGVLRVLVAQSVTDATLVPIEQKVNGNVTLATSKFKLSGLLDTKSDIGGDLFSYGEADAQGVPTKGLAIAGYAFAMETRIEGETADLLSNVTDLAGMQVDQVLSKARAKSLERTFPTTIEAVTVSPSGLKPVNMGEWQVGVAGSDFTAAPIYSLTFDVPLGLLGLLLSLKTDLTAQLFVGWVPGATKAASDKVGLLLRLPPEVSGPGGFKFQGIINSDFEYVQLKRFKLSSSTGGDDTFIYSMLFVHFQGLLLNLLFNYSTGPKDLGLFGGPGDPGGNNSLFFVGKSVDQVWNGPTVSILFEDVPIVFLGRSYEIKTDPTNPNVIDDVFDALNPLTDKTVEQFVNLVFANASLYNSDAGVAFALKFKFKSLALTAVLHDSTFYGAQITLTPMKEEKPPEALGDGSSSSALAPAGSSALARTTGTELAEPEKKKSFKEQIEGFTFTIIYRKVSDEVGVWSADIYLDLGQINLGAFQLSLPNFSISIWTNGDWRFAIGWPFEGDDAHPITVQFQAGPVPVIAKAGFYLGKLSSAAAPEQFGTQFNLIWTFGVGLAAGVGKEWKQGPFKAGASLILGLTVQGFLGSFSGKITDDGVDYWWWGISLSLTGNVFGKVDFKVIVVDVSLTITITIAFAIETKHSSPLKMTATVSVKASIKILFVKISFSFKTTLEIFSFTFGSGPVAKLDAPSPTAVLDTADAIAVPVGVRRIDPEMVSAVHRRAAEVAARRRRYAPGGDASSQADAAQAASAVVPLAIQFVLQPTSISTNGTVWAPQGVATLVLDSGDASSPFGLLSAGLAQWLITAYGGSGSFAEQLAATTLALDEGLFDSQVSQALSETFVFDIGPSKLTADSDVVGLPVHPSLGVEYGGKAVKAALDASPRASLGERRVPANYASMIAAYFGGTAVAEAQASDDSAAGDESTAAMVFDGFFVGFAQQLIELLTQTGAADLASALAELDLGDLGGFASRFLFGGTRLPDPAKPEKLEALYVLTGQQFALQKVDDKWVLDAEMVATASTPSWIKVQADTTSSLDPSTVHTTGPAAPPWQIGQLQALQPKPMIFAMNDNLNLDGGAGGKSVISRFSEGVAQTVRDWRQKTGSTVGPWLVQELVGGEAPEDQQVDLADGGIPWSSSPALLIPVRLDGIPDPSGAPGTILADVFSLLGTDESNRALLQALLADSSQPVTAVDLLVSPSRGNWTSTKTPKVLVRTDLSTANAPPGAVAGAVAAPDASEHCSNYAKPGEGGDELLRYLRLVWEVSVVHSDGFYLQVEGLDLAMFDQGPADLMLLVRFGTAGSTVQVTDYQNALVGLAPEGGKAIFSTFASDAAGTPIEAFGATYPGGSVGWQIVWNNAPAVADAASAGFLQALYQMVSYRVEKVDGVPISTNWSRPVSSQDDSPDGSATANWTYERAFETAPVTGSDNRYADANDTFTVRLSIEDIFGNSLPASLLPTVDLDVLYNDDILGLGDWVGTQAFYLVQANGGEVDLELEISFDPSVVQDAEGKVDPDQLLSTTLLYQQLQDQLTDPNMSASVDTGGVLASAPLTQLTGGGTVLSGLVPFVDSIVAWLEAGGTGTGPSPVTLAMRLDKSHPTKWSGDLRELVVTLVLERSGVSDAIAAKAPQVRKVTSPVQPVEQPTSDKDPTGLTSFANNFEAAYYPFDGAEGVIKVATGTNSDLTSQRFGRRSIWLQRWGVDAGTAVEILNDDDNLPVFYAPPPLSTQLITRGVDGLRQYTNPDQFTDINRVFSSTDMDQWGANFLATVETIFSPQMAPSVAVNSSAQDELYDPFVANKESLAHSISQSVDYVYVEPTGTGDPGSAQETWRQALLRTLENDYGFSTLTQLKALVTLHGDIEPGGDPANPPQLYGAIQVPGEPQKDTLPYSLTPTTLPLVQGANWLNFLVSARDPAAQRAFTLDLDYQVNQLEHLRDGSSSACGYTPSSWLTFILQQNPEPLPQGQKNTLTQPIGTTRIPIPLRTFPPLPKLLATRAFHKSPITTIPDALTWGIEVTVERSGADQDSLNLSLTFNDTEGGVTQTAPAMPRSLASGRPLPVDLYAALARFVFEYPQLKPYIDALPSGGGPESVKAVREFSDLIAGAALTWPEWVAPQSSMGGLARATADSALEVWNFYIQNVEDSVDLEVTATSSRTGDQPPWPLITGYKKVSDQGDTARYQPDGGSPLATLVMSWNELYILDYQNVRPSAFTERNRNLAPPPQETNPDFIYRTETVTWPTPVVPLVSVEQQIELPSGTSLEAAIEAMLDQLTAAPAGSRTNGSGTLLDLETSIDYRYQVMENKGNAVFSLLPVFLLKAEVAQGDEGETAEQISGNLATWRKTTQAESKSASLRFLLTVFSNTIATANDPLPLVQFPGLVIPVPEDDPNWWGK